MLGFVSDSDALLVCIKDDIEELTDLLVMALQDTSVLVQDAAAVHSEDAPANALAPAPVAALAGNSAAANALPPRAAAAVLVVEAANLEAPGSEAAHAGSVAGNLDAHETPRNVPS